MSKFNTIELELKLKERNMCRVELSIRTKTRIKILDDILAGRAQPSDELVDKLNKILP